MALPGEPAVERCGDKPLSALNSGDTLWTFLDAPGPLQNNMSERTLGNSSMLAHMRFPLVADAWHATMPAHGVLGHQPHDQHLFQGLPGLDHRRKQAQA